MSKTLTQGLTPPAEKQAEGLAVYAVIRASSKYAYQGRESGQLVAMLVTHLDDGDEYAFYLENGNRYRREDLTFYVRSSEGEFIKLR